jgi:hypothetical protein
MWGPALLISLVMMFVVQPEPPELAPADPVPYLVEFCRTYQTGGVADRIILNALDADSKEQTVEVVLRRTPVGQDTSTRIDFPEVSFYHSKGVMTAERSGAGKKAVVFQHDSAGEFVDSLSAVMPIWPMPQLWSIQDDGTVIDPALGMLTFTSAEVQNNEVVLTGTSSVGDITLVIDAETHRGIWLAADLRDGKIRCDYTRVQREDPASWEITTDGRWVVTRLAQLALAGPPLGVGQTFNDLDLLTPDFDGISLSELQGMEQVRRSGPWVVLLIINSDADQDLFDLTEEIASGIWSRSAQEIAELEQDDVLRYWLGHRTFVIAVTPDLGILPERVSRIAERAPAGVPLLISTEPEHTLDRFDTEQQIVAVLVDPHRTVGAVVNIETAETGISAVLEAMRSYTRKDVDEEPGGPLLGSE